MAFQPATGVVEAVISYATAGYEWKNVIHFKGLAGDDLGDPTVQQANIIRTVIGTCVIPHLSNQTVLGNVALKLLDTQESGVAVSTSSTSYVGAAIGDPVPLSVAFCATLQTQTGGRTGRGRIYLTGMREVECDARLFAASWVNPLVDHLNAALMAFAAEALNLVVLSRRLGGVVRPVALGRVVVSVVAKDRRIDTQRRRLG